MMNCLQATERMADLLDGRLPAGQRLAMWLHVKVCPPCGRYLQQLRDTANALSRIPPQPAPENLQRAVLDALRRNTSPREPHDG